MSQKNIRPLLSDLYRPQIRLVEAKIDSMLGLKKKDAENDEQETEGKRRRWAAAAS